MQILLLKANQLKIILFIKKEYNNVQNRWEKRGKDFRETERAGKVAETCWLYDLYGQRPFQSLFNIRNSKDSKRV